MKRERISEAMGNIAPKYIDEAAEYGGAVKSVSGKAWRKWAAAAACLALVIAIGFPIAKDYLGSQGRKDIADSVMCIEYDGAYWEIVEDMNSLSKYGLEKEITEDVIGNHIAYLQKETPDAVRSNYIASDEETGAELLVYAPAPFQAVRIFRDGGKYFYALFCNYLIQSNESLPMEAGLAVYGINGAEDIAAITPVKSDNTWQADGDVITDRAVIDDFVGEISALNEKREGDTGSGRVAEDRKDMVIETKDGLRFAIQYYPSYGWIYMPPTLSYYQMSSELSDWFSRVIR